MVPAWRWSGMHKPPCFSSSVSASGLDAAGGRAPTCTHSPEVLAPGVPLGQVRLHQLSCRRELDGAPACPAQGSGVPSPKGQSLLGSHGAAPFLCVTAGFPRLPCTGVPSRRESLAALSARCVPALGSGWPYSFYLHVLLDLGSQSPSVSPAGISGPHHPAPRSRARVPTPLPLFPEAWAQLLHRGCRWAQDCPRLLLEHI